MPRVDEENKLTKAYLAVREWLPSARLSLKERYAFVRQTPGTVWKLPELRIGLLLIAAFLAVQILTWSIGLLRPSLAEKPFATSGDFQITCINPPCQKQYAIQRKFSFDDFPIECPHCHQKTGQRALRCHSERCRGALVPTKLDRGAYVCLLCDKNIKKE